MKLSMIMIALTALAWHHGALAQCDCDCTCPSTISTCSPTETTSEMTKAPTTTTTSTTNAPTTTTTTPKPTTTTTATTTTSVPITTPIPPYSCGIYTIEVGKQVPMQSPNYPDKYGKKDTCKWELTCDNANGVISISCDDFKTESAEDCKDADFVRIKDGKGDKLGDFCGGVGPDLTTSDNIMEVTFKTDKDKKRKTGFSCTAKCSVPTTTVPPTTTVTTTTTTEQSYSGQCSLDWTATDTETATWESPNYDGTTTYPEGDYCCWLNVTIPDTYSQFMVNMVMSDKSTIHESSGCTGDKITYHSSTDQTSILCGDLDGQSWTETAVFNTPLVFGFQWCSDTTDGGTDIGFQMTLTGTNLLG